MADSLTYENHSSSGHTLHGRSSGKRACIECSRKKSKCDMVLSRCSLCVKTDSICVYPTTRKPRTLRNPKHPYLLDMEHPQSDLNNNQLYNRAEPSAGVINVGPDTFLSGDSILDSRGSTRSAPLPDNFAIFMDATSGMIEREDDSIQGTSPQQSITVTESSYSSNNTSGSKGDLEYSTTIPDSSLTLVPSQLSPPGDMRHSQMPVFFNRFSVPLLGLDVFNDGWQPPQQEESSGTNDVGWNSSSADWPFLLPESQHIPELGVFQSSPTQASRDRGVRGTTETSENMFGLDDPPELIDALIEIYFEKVQGFLPLLHKPRFMETEISKQAASDSRFQQISLETSLILNGMCALSARFSSDPAFDGIKPVQKGARFGHRAKSIYDNSIRDIKQPSLKFLQGCILLAFYLYSCEPDCQGWLLIGTCSRLAYDFGLNKIDDDRQSINSTLNMPSLEWSRREELRRAWWCVWELDTFASGISCRPPTIDSYKMQVRLPVSDRAWFANMPVESVIMDPNPLVAWRSLRDCPNQDERAWFLVLNFLLFIAQDLGQETKPDHQRAKNIENAVSCFVLLLPSQFHLDSGSILFNSEHFQRSNWIMCTNIMLQGCQIFVRFLTEKASQHVSSTLNNQRLAPLAAASKFGTREMEYRPYTEQIIRCIRRWSPEHIPYSSPFIGCLILGPAAIHVRVAKGIRDAVNDGNESQYVEAHLLELTLGHIARYWGIGSAILDLATWMAGSNSPGLKRGS